MVLITLAGFPAAMQLAGIGLVTTLAAAITELSPIITPLSTITRLPSQTLLPMMTGFVKPALRFRVAGLIS